MSLNDTLTILLVIVILALVGLAFIPPRRRQPATPHPSTARTEECETCGAEISILVAHRITSSFEDTNLFGAGGTAMSAAYCTNHCPGSCDKPHMS